MQAPRLNEDPGRPNPCNPPPASDDADSTLDWHPFTDSHWHSIVQNLHRELDTSRTRLRAMQLIALALFIALVGLLAFL
jgi:hypothetical protein